jgi:hypothetical protein
VSDDNDQYKRWPWLVIFVLGLMLFAGYWGYEGALFVTSLMVTAPR